MRRMTYVSMGTSFAVQVDLNMSICALRQNDNEVTCARVLVIEDERRNRQFLRASLVSYGYRLTEADTGAAGVKHAHTCATGLIILDLGLPDMDSIEVIRTIRKSSQVPILVTSAATEASVRLPP